MKAYTIMATLFITASSQVYHAQSYFGGNAFVEVTNNYGISRVLNVTVPCAYETESEVKSELKHAFIKSYNEEYTSGIKYSIDKCYTNDTRHYGGSASVRVANLEGYMRVLNVTVPCAYKTVSEAKGNLLYSFTKRYDEDYISPVRYDIDSCP